MKNYKIRQIVTNKCLFLFSYNIDLQYLFSYNSYNIMLLLINNNINLLQPQCCIALSWPKRESNRQPSGYQQ